MTQWEYKDIQLGRNQPLSELNIDELGKEGWEMCGIISGEIIVFFFKRKIDTQRSRRAV